MRKGHLVLVIFFSALALAALVIFAPLLFGTRALTDSERSAAEPLFGQSIAYDAVRIRSGGPLTWFGAGVTIGNVISFPSGGYSGTGEDLPWLMHELTHVWQYRHFGLGYIPRSVWEQMSEPDAYKVHYVGGKAFLDYDVEEQAVIVEDYYVSKREPYEPLINEMRGVAEPGGLTL